MSLSAFSKQVCTPSMLTAGHGGASHLIGHRLQVEAVSEEVTLLGHEPPAQLICAAICQAQYKVGNQVLPVGLTGSGTAEVLADKLFCFLLSELI